MGFSQAKLNEDSINYYFAQIVSEYRISNNLNQLTVDKDYKYFTDHWSRYIYNLKKSKDSVSYYREYFSHGVGETHFHKRAENIMYLEPCENAIETFDLSVPKTYDGYKFENLTRSVDINYLKYVAGKFGTNITNEDVAWFIFLVWKDSPKHNVVLLYPSTTKFYISTYVVGNKMTVSYIGLKDIY